MRRVLFHFHGRSIYSYPAMLYLGIVLGIYAELYAASTIALNLQAILTATLILIATALLGARLLHVLPHWRHYRQYPGRILKCADGGASMYGGLLLAFPASVPVLALLGLPFATFWDLASFAMLVGMVITRAGCFLNGCCSGRPTTGWCGMNLTNYRGVRRRRIPVQILEAAWGTAVLAGAVLLWGRLPFPGSLFLYAVGAYGLGRVLLESLRDEQDRVGGVSLHKAISLGLIATALGAFAAGWLSMALGTA